METIPSETDNLIANLPTITTDPSSCVTASNCPGLNTFYFPHNPTNKNFEPRIGFAWDPFRNGKTAIRGGFGLFDALPLPYELVINNAQTSPFHVVATVLGCPQPPGVNCVAQGAFPSGISFSNPPAPSQTWNYVDTNIKRNYIYQWNLSVQRQFTGSLSLTLAYAGSRAIHNPLQLDDINTVFPTLTQGRWLFPNPIGSGCQPGACGVVSSTTNAIVPGQLINPNVAAIQTTLWASLAYYNSFQVQVEKRMSHGLQLLSSFTWSKTMDTTSGSFAGDNFSGDLSPTIPWWDLKIIRGLSDFNVGRNLTVNLLYNLPTPESFSGPAGWIAKGWQVGTILQASDGVPIWPLDGVEGDLMGQLNSEPIAIPDRVAGCQLIFPSSGRHGSLQYINPACLINAQAPSAAFYTANCSTTFPEPTCINLLGNLGRNTIIGPGLFNVDFSLVKNNHIPRISESFNVQFRAEFFNVFNHTNFAPPVDNLEAIDATGAPIPGFGQIDATQVPNREIQFALKFIW